MSRRLRVTFSLGLVFTLAMACERRAVEPVGDASVTASVTPRGEPTRRAAPPDAAAEELPSWVPRSGRLTIVSARDRDRNLGLGSSDAGAPEAR